MDYASGREGDGAIVARCSRKDSISLYISCMSGGRYSAEAAKSRLGKVSVGQSCIRFKRLEDLNLPTVLELVRHAAPLIDRQGGDFSL